MRVTRQQHGLHHTALLEQAARLFRAQGLQAVGVAEIGRAAGLTHGAVYSHFTGKDDLAAAAFGANLTGAAAAWRARAARHRSEGREPLAALVAAYLSPSHRDTPEAGCMLASLGPEATRAGPHVAAALHDGTCALTGVLAELLAERAGGTPAAHQATATAMLATMTGGLILARTLATDPEASRAALQAAADAALSFAPLPAARTPPCSPP
jgi:TetR/AcrR family transcriptional repressor of nem operon